MCPRHSSLPLDRVCTPPGACAAVHLLMSDLVSPACPRRPCVCTPTGGGGGCCAACLSRGLACADFAHHIGTSVQLVTPACQYLYKERNRKRGVFDIFTQVRCCLLRVALLETDGRRDARCYSNREIRSECFGIAARTNFGFVRGSKLWVD